MFTNPWNKTWARFWRATDAFKYVIWSVILWLRQVTIKERHESFEFKPTTIWVHVRS